MIYFLSFYTEGIEIDGCLDLTDNAMKIKENLSKYFDGMFLFNKRTLKMIPGSEDVCNVYEEETNFLNGNKLGYFDFKPFIIGHVLSIIPENSILIYHDSNFDKYPTYWNTDWSNLELISNKILDDNKTDFWVKFELNPNEYCLVKNFVKTYTVDYFFKNIVEKNIINNSNLFNAGQIILRNTEKSRDLIKEWSHHCENKDLLKITPNPNPHPDLKMSCQEQDVLNCVIYKQILDGKIPPEFPIYSFNWRSIRMSNYFSLKNTELINYLSNSKNLK
jgi:hypothetical protein